MTLITLDSLEKNITFPSTNATTEQNSTFLN